MTTVAADTTDYLAYRRWLAGEADWVATETAASELGRRARRAYVDRLAVRNLLRAAETSGSVSDLLDYVKVRISRQPQWRREAFGPTLLQELERLRSRTTTAAPPTTSGYAAAPHLDLCRLFVRQLASSYVYSIAVDVTAPRTASPVSRPVRPPAAPPAPRQRDGDRRSRSAHAAERARDEAGSAAEAETALVSEPAEVPAAEAPALAEPEAAEASGHEGPIGTGDAAAGVRSAETTPATEQTAQSATVADATSGMRQVVEASAADTAEPAPAPVAKAAPQADGERDVPAEQTKETPQ